MPGIARPFRPLVVALLVLLVAPIAAVASGSQRTLLLQPAWHWVARTAPTVSSGYAFFAFDPAGSTLVDDRTGRSRQVDYRGCTFDAMGGGRLAFTCGPNVRLYNVTTGVWSVVPFLDCGDHADGCSAEVARVGSDWIEWLVSPGREQTAYFAFQNTGTGAVRRLDAWKPGGRIIPNLNLVCAGPAALFAAPGARL